MRWMAKRRKVSSVYSSKWMSLSWAMRKPWKASGRRAMRMSRCSMESSWRGDLGAVDGETGEGESGTGEETPAVEAGGLSGGGGLGLHGLGGVTGHSS